MKVLVIQEKVPLYRIPFFEGLSSAFNHQFTVTLCDTITSNKGSYAIHMLHDTTVRKLHITNNLYKVAKEADVIVTMFDVRWISLLFWSIYFRHKTLLWGHGYGKNKLSNYLRLWLMKLVKGVLVYEESAAKQIIHHGIDKNKVFYTGNTVYVGNHGRAEKGHRTQFIYVGRLQERKELYQIIDAFNIVQDVMPSEIGIQFIGDGIIRSDMENKVKELGLSNRVTISGAIYDENELKSHFDEAIAYISPGHVGLGVLHSFAYGVPVVTRSDRQHAPEVENIKDKVTGLFYHGDAKKLAEIMLSLANGERGNEMGRAAYHRYIEHRTMGMMIDRTRKAIEYVAEASRNK